MTEVARDLAHAGVAAANAHFTAGQVSYAQERRQVTGKG
jgi:hypothetical protein